MATIVERMMTLLMTRLIERKLLSCPAFRSDSAGECQATVFADTWPNNWGAS